MNKDIFLSILSMDAYNRSYGQGIDGLYTPNFDENGIATSIVKLGNATIIQDSSIIKNVSGLRSDSPASFYAIAYDVTGVSGFNAGQTVISFRGTDEPIADAFEGFGVALGRTTGPQATLSQTFYDSVIAATNAAASQITLTGHSLGGGLAGYIGSVNGANSAIFDHMPFGTAATNKLQSATPSSAPQFDTVTAFHVAGEILESVRSGELQAWAAISTLFSPLASIPIASVLTALAPSQLNDLAISTVSTEALVSNQAVDISASGINAIDRHSSALMVDILFAQTLNDNIWRTAAPALWSAYFDDSIASAIPKAVSLTGAGVFASPGNTLRTAIAYSAIDEGERPFGDTGIRAMFDDAGDLGRAIQNDGEAGRITKLAPAISKTLVQYAGELALNHVSANNEDGTQNSAATQAIQSLNGVVSLSADKSAITIDYRPDIWTSASGGTMPTMLSGKTELLSALFPSLQVATPNSPPPSAVYAGTPGLADVQKAMLSAWGNGSTNIFDSVVVAIGGAGSTANLPENSVSGYASLFVGAEGVDTVSGSSRNDMLIGNGGNDHLSGGIGDDIFFGGADDNVLDGGSGNDTFVFHSTEAGTSTISDDEGTLVIDGFSVGRKPISMGGSITSGIAVQNPVDLQWYLGGYKATAVAAANGTTELHLDQGGQHIILQDWQTGDFGISLGSIDYTITNNMGSPTDTLNQYTFHTSSSTSFVTAFAATVAASGNPQNYTFNGYAHQPLNAAGASGITANATNVIGTAANDSYDVSNFHITMPFTISTFGGQDNIKSNGDAFSTQTVYAGDGFDTLTTFGGAGSVYGEAGDDIINLYSFSYKNAVNYGQALTQVFGGTGRDHFEGVGAAFIDGGGGVDSWGFNLFADDFLTFKDHDVTLDSINGIFSVANSPFSGTFSSIESFVVKTAGGNDTITTLNADDYIETGSGINVIDARGGNDIIWSFGSDTVHGGDGNDTITAFGVNSQNVSTFNLNNVVFYGDAGDDTLSGGDGNDQLFSGDGNDIINGNAGNDVLFGDAGNDTLSGGAGTNTVDGGTGDDLIIISSAVHNDTYAFRTGDGNDTVQFNTAIAAGSTGSITINGDALSGMAAYIDVDHWQITTGGQTYDLNRLKIPFNGAFIITPDLLITSATSPSDSIKLTGYFSHAMADNAVAFGFSLEAPHPVNHAPVGSANLPFPAGKEDKPVKFSDFLLLSGFSDPDFDPLSISSITADHANIESSGPGYFTYTPHENYNGPVKLTYQISDGKGGVINATQSFQLAAVNDAPKLTGSQSDIPHAVQDKAFIVNAAALLQGFTDVDGDVLSVSGLAADHGHVADNHDGTFTVTPSAGYSGSLGLSYQVVDGNGGVASGAETVIVDPTTIVAPPPTNADNYAALPTGLVASDYSAFDHNVRIKGNSLGNTIKGTAFDDIINGGGGNDTLYGLGSNDKLNGGPGADVTIGGDGNDTYVVRRQDIWHFVWRDRTEDRPRLVG